jgi:anti-sigma28 factor (negative regulator of flagellin synthesis)
MLMKINGGSNGPIRPDAKRDERLQGTKLDGNGNSAVRTDTVEISDAGRAKAAQTTDARPARLQAIRDRILQGAYDTDEVVGEVARRILDRGDLQPVPPSEIQ